MTIDQIAPVPGASASVGRSAGDSGNAGDTGGTGDSVVPSHGEAWSRKAARLRDVPLDISAQIGRTRLPIRAVLELGVGQVIELDRQVGAPIDIIANNDVVIARGEVVEVDDEYGVRITEVVHGALD